MMAWLNLLERQRDVLPAANAQRGAAMRAAWDAAGWAHAGFATVARVADMLRIEGVSHDLSYMTIHLRER